ncbi:MAG: beta-glucosidase family protein [Caulobacterales bacterium]|jgi:beta-glucosidase
MPDLSPRKGMSEAEIATTIAAILQEATLDEKVAMMSGAGFFRIYQESGRRWGAAPYPAGSGCARLGVAPLYFTDGPRGVARGSSTCFPCTMARGASFDIDLERRIGEVMGIEARAQGCTLSGAVCVNLLRHPAWGRAQETYGEDPHHLGEMGAALAIGIQTHNVIATVKHFALNSMENARFKVDVACDGRTMREVYLPHFKRILDAGCASVMSAYNQWNGEYCGQNRTLLTDILRHEWGFTGFVHSDWVFGLRAVYAAAAGLDIENPEPIVFNGLAQSVRDHQIEPHVIDTACTRILSTQFHFACAEDPYPDYTPDMVAQPAHIAIALEAAQKSAVLLKNAAVLPFNPARIKTLAVLGKLAALENTGDRGSSNVRPPYVVTALQGLSARLGEQNILTGDEDNIAAAAEAADAADAIVVVAGYTHKDEGEYIPSGGIDLGQANNPALAAIVQAQSHVNDRGDIGGDRVHLSLPAAQIALIRAAAQSGKPVVVVIVAGSAVMVEEWIDEVGAVLQTFYSGMEGGTALAQLLFGDVSPSGRLPFTVARRADDYPYFDKDADRIEYGSYHGYTLFEKNDRQPRFGFGHGLSYAAFRYRAVKVRRSANALEVQVTVCNESAHAGHDVVLCFIAPPGLQCDRPKRLLKAFARIALRAGERRSVFLRIPLTDLKWWDQNTAEWRLEPGRYGVSIGHADAAAWINL